MKRALMIGGGALLMLASLWGGAYAVDVFGTHDWRGFPSAFTAGCAGFVGLMIVFRGIDL